MEVVDDEFKRVDVPVGDSCGVVDVGGVGDVCRVLMLDSLRFVRRPAGSGSSRADRSKNH